MLVMGNHMGREETGDTSSALVGIFWPTHSARFILYTIVGNLQLEALGHLFLQGFISILPTGQRLRLTNEMPRFQHIFKFLGSVFLEKQITWTQLRKMS